MRKGFSREVLPVRLIDVAATLSHAPARGGIHFIAPSSWDFHVISHTWSLDVRNFSTLIGQQILNQLDQADPRNVIINSQPTNPTSNQAPDEIIPEISINLPFNQAPNYDVISIAQVDDELLIQNSSTHPFNQAANYVISGEKSTNHAARNEVNPADVVDDSSKEPTNQSTTADIDDEFLRQEEIIDQDLNDVINSEQPGSQASDAAGLYNAFFAQADLRGEPAFHGLLEFLGFLEQEGVAFVWFDALCINQTDEQGEKAREIANMGAYYSNSIGCYVLVHGMLEIVSMENRTTFGFMEKKTCALMEKVDERFTINLNMMKGRK